MFNRVKSNFFFKKSKIHILQSLFKQRKFQILSAVSLTVFFANQFSAKEELKFQAGVIKKELPYYTQKEIKEHNNEKNRIWVTYKDGVYDITDFISMHPGIQHCFNILKGGEKILMAAGLPFSKFC
jgi:hypothetical protein